MKRAEQQQNLAMMVVHIMTGMLFTTLFMGYAIYRASAQTWPPMGVSKIALGWPMLSSVAILMSSWFCHQVVVALRSKQFEKAKMDLHVTIALGFCFMLIQGFLWSHMKSIGLYTSSGIFASVIYAFTWIHAAHMVLGLGSLTWLKLVFKPSNESLLQKAVNVEKFWHFLGLVWLIMFITIFVI